MTEGHTTDFRQRPGIQKKDQELAAIRKERIQTGSEREKEQQLLLYRKKLLAFDKKARNLEEVEKADRLKGECARAKEQLQKAKDGYQRMRHAEREYQRRLQPHMMEFYALVADLACFAGCRREEEYPVYELVFRNRQSHIKRYFDTHPKQPDFTIPEFPDLSGVFRPEDSKPKASGAEASKSGDSKSEASGADFPEPGVGYSGSKLEQKIRQVLHSAWFSTKGKMKSKQEQARLLQTCENLYQSCIASEWAKKKSRARTEVLKEEIHGNKKQLERLMKEIEEYQSDELKIGAYLSQKEKEWDYMRLLSKAYPVLWEIAQGAPMEGEAAWYSAIGNKIWHLPEEINPECRLLHFYWILPDSRECANSREIRLDFLNGEAPRPGLYYKTADSSRLVCVVPGCFANEAFTGKA